jgi:hypothetical protein
MKKVIIIEIGGVDFSIALDERDDERLGFVCQQVRRCE